MSPVRPIGPAESIPSYTCRVLVGPAAHAPGRILARVANLGLADGGSMEALADSERAALQQVVGVFKRRVAELTRDGKEIPWIEPPHSPESHEQTRLIAVHS